ncbi:MAG: DNA repair protein RecO [Flavobacteriales bacterium]|nr:DNA repair protein RecO [Flavobacteriales bacterium]
MLTTTKGIVIHHFKYSEKSVIAKIYTEKYGLQSYILNGVRNKKSKNKAVFLQPLSLVEISAIHKEKAGLSRVKNIDLEIPFKSIPFTISKSSLAFFISEILYKSIKEEEANEHLFTFLHHSIEFLDLTDGNYNNFHLIFLAKLSKHLGFHPQKPIIPISSKLYFDLQEGCFSTLQPYHNAFVEPPVSTLFFQVFGTNFDAMEALILNQKQRKILLSTLLNYYSLHLSNFDNLKTLDILEEVLS